MYLDAVITSCGWINLLRLPYRQTDSKKLGLMFVTAMEQPDCSTDDESNPTSLS